MYVCMFVGPGQPLIFFPHYGANTFLNTQCNEDIEARGFLL